MLVNVGSKVSFFIHTWNGNRFIHFPPFFSTPSFCFLFFVSSIICPVYLNNLNHVYCIVNHFVWLCIRIRRIKCLSVCLSVCMSVCLDDKKPAKVGKCARLIYTYILSLSYNRSAYWQHVIDVYMADSYNMDSETHTKVNRTKWTLSVYCTAY